MMTASRIKRLAAKAGADLCGVAPVSRFSQAPPGFAPADIWADARSVVVVARRLPEGAMRAPGPVPYTWANEATLTESVFGSRATWRSCSRTRGSRRFPSRASRTSTGMTKSARAGGYSP